MNVAAKSAQEIAIADRPPRIPREANKRGNFNDFILKVKRALGCKTHPIDQSTSTGEHGASSWEALN